MAGITIRRPEERVKLKLGTRAAANAQPMEEEARQILRSMPDQVPAHTDQNMDSVVGFRLADDRTLIPSKSKIFGLQAKTNCVCSISLTVIQSKE